MIGYKYRSFEDEHNIDALSNNYIWASDVANLNDPHECSSEFLIDKELDILRKYLTGLDEHTKNIKSAIDDLKSKKTKIGIYSMSKDPLSTSMWTSYAGSQTGFCVGYDIELLKKYYLAPLTVYECDVKYQNTHPTISMLDIRDEKKIISRLFATKSKNWEFESEIRLIFDDMGKKQHPWQAVKEVFFGLKTSEGNKNKVLDKLKNYDVKFYQVCTDNLYGKLKAELILENSRPFQYSKDEYEILHTNHNPAAENFHLLIKKTNPTDDYLQDFAIKFRDRYATINANIYLYSKKIDIDLFEKHLLNEKETEILNSVSLGNLVFGCDQLLK